MRKLKHEIHDDATGLALEKSFRRAVKISLKNNYVSYFDEPENHAGSPAELLQLLNTFTKEFKNSSRKKTTSK